MNIHKTMHDMGVKITKDIMDPLVGDFQRDIDIVRTHLFAIEGKLDLLLDKWKEWEDNSGQ